MGRGDSASAHATFCRSPVAEQRLAANVVANLAFLAGFFCLAMTISLVSEEVKRLRRITVDLHERMSRWSSTFR